MADIAAIFHWGLAELSAVPLAELLHWHGLAIDRMPKPPEMGI